MTQLPKSKRVDLPLWRDRFERESTRVRPRNTEQRSNNCVQAGVKFNREPPPRKSIIYTLTPRARVPWNARRERKMERERERERKEKEKRGDENEENEGEKHSRIMPRCEMHGSPRIITSARPPTPGIVVLELLRERNGRNHALL